MSDRVKFSIRFNNDLPVAAYIPLARAAEAAGFDQFWVGDDLFLRSAPVILSAVATATSRIEIGTCIVNPYTLHPAEMAMLAVTLDELSGGRFNLGLSAGAGEFLKWVGITPDKPHTAVRETLTTINRLTAGERVEHHGDFLHYTNEAYLRFEAARRVPIYIGALSPRMLRLTGELADGGLPLLFPPEHYETVAPLIAAGAAAAGRDLAAVDVAACVWCSLSDDKSAAENALREKIAYYGHALSPLILQRLGLAQADFAPIEQAAMVENDLPRAMGMVTPAMLRIGIAGTARDLIARLEGLVALGVRHLSLGPPLGPKPLEAIAVVGREVIPHFRKTG